MLHMGIYKDIYIWISIYGEFFLDIYLDMWISIYGYPYYAVAMDAAMVTSVPCKSHFQPGSLRGLQGRELWRRPRSPPPWRRPRRLQRGEAAPRDNKSSCTGWTRWFVCSCTSFRLIFCWFLLHFVPLAAFGWTVDIWTWDRPGLSMTVDISNWG